jgi:hypothetical protein
MEGLASASSFVKGELGRRLKMRRTPELVFVLDRGFERSANVLGILHQLEQKRLEKRDLVTDADAGNDEAVEPDEVDEENADYEEADDEGDENADEGEFEEEDEDYEGDDEDMDDEFEDEDEFEDGDDQADGTDDQEAENSDTKTP